MTCKFMRKLMVVMIELAILLIEVQANEIHSISFPSSPLQIPLREGPIYNCLGNELELEEREIMKYRN